MTVAVIRFPSRRSAAVFVTQDRGDGLWLALAGSHGWVFADRDDAISEARWLSHNLSLPIRDVCHEHH
jgi:hypothetical protein